MHTELVKQVIDLANEVAAVIDWRGGDPRVTPVPLRTGDTCKALPFTVRIGRRCHEYLLTAEGADLPPGAAPLLTGDPMLKYTRLDLTRRMTPSLLGMIEGLNELKKQSHPRSP